MNAFRLMTRRAMLVGAASLVAASFAGTAFAGDRPTRPTTRPAVDTNAKAAVRGPARAQANTAAQKQAAQQAKQAPAKPQADKKPVARPGTLKSQRPAPTAQPRTAPSAVKPTIAPVNAKNATKPSGAAPQAATGKSAPSFHKKVDAGQANAAKRKFKPKQNGAAQPAPASRDRH